MPPSSRAPTARRAARKASASPPRAAAGPSREPETRRPRSRPAKAPRRSALGIAPRRAISTVNADDDPIQRGHGGGRVASHARGDSA